MEQNAQTNDPTGRLAGLRALLEAAEAEYAILEHEATIATARQGAESGLGTLRNMAPAFILKTEAGYLAAVIRGDTRLAYKKIKQRLGLKNVSLAGPEQVREVSVAEVGYVSLVNPGLKTIVDEKLLEVDVVYGGCGVPNTTLQIRPADLVRAAQAEVFDFSELKNSQGSDKPQRHEDHKGF